NYRRIQRMTVQLKPYSQCTSREKAELMRMTAPWIVQVTKSIRPSSRPIALKRGSSSASRSCVAPCAIGGCLRAATQGDSSEILSLKTLMCQSVNCQGEGQPSPWPFECIPPRRHQKEIMPQTQLLSTPSPLQLQNVT